MPNNFTIPADTHVDNDPQHTSHHNQITDALRGAVGISILDSRFGADPTGAGDSTAAIQNAINALPSSGGKVIVPGLIPGTSTAATYRCDAGKLSPVSGLHLQGDGYGCATITCNGAGQAGAPYLFNLDPTGYNTTTHVEDLQITGLLLDVTAADIFWGANIVRSKIVGNWLRQRSAGFAIMNVAQATGQAGANNGSTYMAENIFANKEYVDGGTRTIEAWHLDFSGTGLRCNDNLWHGGGSKIWSSNGGDTSMYWMKIIGDAAGSRGSKHNTWRDLIFELPSGTGGLIHLLQMEIVEIDNISMEDLAANTVGNPLILLNTIGGGAEGCQQVSINSYSRRSGSGVSNTNPDIKLDGNCDRVVIRDPKQGSGGTAFTVDVQSATNVRVDNPPASWVLLNPGTGFHAPPASPASTQPSDPVGTTSATAVMMGLGVTYTPKGTGQVLVTVTGIFRDSTATGAGTVGGRFGTGSAPANGAAVTGTRFGGAADFNVVPSGTATGIPFTLQQVLSLTAGTTYWFDTAVSSSGTAVANTRSVTMTFVEQP